MKITILFAIISLILSGCFFERQDEKSINLKGFNFSFADIEGLCAARRLGDSDNIVISCSDTRLRPVSQSCEGFIIGGLRETQLTCSGGLWIVKDHCEIKMRSAQQGEIFCRV